MTYAIYFSPTDTNRRNAKAAASAFGEYKMVDLTYPKEFENINLNSDDVAVFAAPVYGGRVFKGAIERMKTVKGSNTPCIVITTYGNRHYDDALVEMCDFAKEQGFVPVAAFALIGEHTYGQIQLGRPNEDDLAQTKEMAVKVKEKIEKGELTLPEVPGNRPYKDGGNGGGFKTHTESGCISCGVCANICPMGAVSHETFEVDQEKCIACFACVKGCPVGAKLPDLEKYNPFAEDFSEKLKNRRENEYYL